MKSKMIELKSGFRIHVLINNNYDKPCLVFLHGYPSNCNLWRNIIPALSNDFNIFVPDLPGHGKSDKPLDIDYDLDFFHQFLIDFYLAADLEKASVIAHDLGGMAGLSLAVRDPELIERLVIMNTGPYKEWPVLMKIFLLILKQKPLTPLFLMPFAFKYLLKQGIYNKNLVTKDLVAMYRDPWINSSEGRMSFAKTIDMPVEKLVEPVDDIRKINLPTLVLWGKKDRFFPSSVAWRLHKDIPGSKLELIPDAGHFLQEEDPDLISEKLISFLNS